MNSTKNTGLYSTGDLSLDNIDYLKQKQSETPSQRKPEHRYFVKSEGSVRCDFCKKRKAQKWFQVHDMRKVTPVTVSICMKCFSKGAHQEYFNQN